MYVHRATSIIHCTLYSVYCIVYSVQCIIVHILYTGSTVCTMQYALYIVPYVSAEFVTCINLE